MQKKNMSSRRQFIKLGSLALSALPLLFLSGKASAATNTGMRTAMKYQDKPNGDKSCSGCAQFVPGKSAKDLGGCKLFPGDTEISPNGFCIAWMVKPK
ncbi:high-potential iron-sulfur protein [Solimicrobium silvestre]|uniref:High-potential iron-sulfur protein n=1 Tax=Solimicrobium silvestre TaxID=2099400 RepID=A0A2S9H3I2_9BURK|nr:High potential iron-sulfur protein [Solimicrobium silvestre]